MKKLILIMFIILLVSIPAMASYELKVSHDVELTLSGEWDFDSIIVTPSGANHDLSLAGTGDAMLKSKFVIVECESVDSNWWELF